MQRDNVHPSPRRALASGAALLILLFAGAGAALADHGRRGDQRYDRHGRGDRCEVHRGDRYREHRGHHRDDRYRDRYDRRGAYDRHRYDDRYRRQQRYVPYRRYFEVPQVITYRHLDAYRAYRHGQVYYSPHRHDHEIYRFPVYGEHGVEYYPYAYCEGSFFARGVFRGGHAWFDLRFGF